MIKIPQDIEIETSVVNNHSEHVTRLISELMEQGAIGIEVALLIDCIDDETVLLQGYRKPELFHTLHVLVTRFSKENTGKLTPAKAERMNVLLNSLNHYLDGISASLFLNETVQAHTSILRHGIELYKQRNFQIFRPQRRGKKLSRKSRK